MKKDITIKKKCNRLFLLSNQKGFSLTEVLAAATVSIILIAMAATAIITFYAKYKELSYYADLQQQAFDAVEVIKYGYPVQGAIDLVFLGIANARSITMDATSGGWGMVSGVTCYPDRTAEGHSNDYVRYYWDRNTKSIMVQGLYGVRFYQEQLFPQRNDSHIEVTELGFTSLTGAEQIKVVEMTIKARVIISEEKHREITYKTNIALSR